MEIALIAILTAFASLIGTMTGFGTSTLLIPALALFMPTLDTIVLASAVHWFGNIWKIAFFRSGFRSRLIALFGIPGVVAAAVGAFLAVRADQDLLARGLGALLAMHGFALLARPTFAMRPSDGTAIAGGAVSGFLAGLTGIGGAVRGAALALFNLPKATFIATAGAIGLFVDSTRLAVYFLEGSTVQARLAWGLAVFIPASLIGAAFAKRIVDRIPQTRFRSVVAVFLLLVGVKFLISP